jgi:group I intron endonuclease
MPEGAGASPPSADALSLVSAADAWACRQARISRLPGVYIVYCAPEERCYIGSTTCLRTRYSTHWSKLRRGSHENMHLQAAWEKHGPNAVRFGVLEELPGAADDAAEPLRLARENHWLSRITRADLYNMTIPATASLRTTPAARRKRTP